MCSAGVANKSYFISAALRAQGMPCSRVQAGLCAGQLFVASSVMPLACQSIAMTLQWLY